jgi:TonB-dependent starch-binding outer membrane protein SusC
MKQNYAILRCLLLLISVWWSGAASGQSTKVSGKVTSSDDGGGIPGVNIIIKGTTQGTVTDADGVYTISADANATLVFTSIGYALQELVVGGRSTIDVTMTPDVSTLSEIVVVGYGNQKQIEVTGAVSQVNATALKDLPVPNVGQKLQGRIAGVQVVQANGEPGQGLSFRIRGQASINAGNSPLFVIDGFPSVSGINTLSPDEIESITVLKDASASSLYGSRAANGVILITTKQAKDGQANVEVSGYTGVETVSDRGRPDVMNAQEFAQFKKEYYEDAALYEGYTAGVPLAYQNPAAVGQGTDWYDILLRQAKTQNVNVSLTSGVQKLKSAVNLNYNNQEGVILNTYSERMSARANNIYKVNDRLTFGMNLSLTYRRSQITPGLGGGRNIIGSAFLMDPQLRYQNDDGTYPISYQQPGMFGNPNYYLVLTRRKNPTRETVVLANAYGEYEILKGLKYKLSANTDLGQKVNRTFEPSNARGGMFSPPPLPAIGSYGTENYNTWLIENTLTYTKTLAENHNFEALAGYSTQKASYESSGISASQYPDDEIEWINAATTRVGNGSATEWSMISYIGRLNYNFKSKYLLSLAFRRDGSSRFGQNAKWGNFPSVSVGWIVSEEDFFSGIGSISHLKLRGSYGKTGNNNLGDLGNYAHQSGVSTTNYVLNNQVIPGRALSRIGNENLTWETTVQYDAGLEVGLLGDRIFLTYDYYWKKTDGLLYGINIPTQTGFSQITSNIGQFNFWGHEFTIESKNLSGKKLGWNTSFNISFNRNEAVKLGTNNTPIGGNANQGDYNRTQVGHPLGQFMGYVNDGVYMTQEEFDSQPKHATSMVGTVRYKDISGPNGVPDGRIDFNDRTIIGDPNPDFIYGLTNEFTYGNFDASIVIAGAVGGDIIDGTLEWTENLDGVFNVTKEMAQRWRSPENPGNGYIPRTRTGTTEPFRFNNTRWVSDGSYLAVKNITIGYSYSFTEKVVKRARIYFSTQNPFTLTNYRGMNPEVNNSGLNGLYQGVDISTYPISKIYTLGVNISL